MMILHVIEMNSLFRCSKNGEKIQEKIDNVKVKRNRCPNILVIRVPLYYVVRVIDYVPTEYQCRQATINHSCDLSEWEKHLQGRKRII